MKNIALIKTGKKLNSNFLNYYLINNKKRIYDTISQGGAQAFLSLKTLQTLRIPLPKLEIQDKIVEQIAQEQNLITANKLLINMYEKKIKDRIARVWGE